MWRAPLPPMQSASTRQSTTIPTLPKERRATLEVPLARGFTQVTYKARNAVMHFFESVEPLRQDGCRKVVVDDITSHNFASIPGDSGVSSTSFSVCSETEVAASTISDTELFDHAPRDRLRQQDYGHRFSPREGWGSREQHIVRNIRRHYKHNGREALHQQRSLHEEQFIQQHRDLQKNHIVEASILAVQTTTQLNATFRALEYDISAEKDELNRIRMQEFAIHAEESIRAQRQLYVQEAGKEIRRYEHASGTLIKYTICRIRVWSLSRQNSARKAIESDRHRLQNQESFLSHKAQRCECRHQQEVIQMQKQLDEASKQSQEISRIYRENQQCCKNR